MKLSMKQRIAVRRFQIEKHNKQKMLYTRKPPINGFLINCINLKSVFERVFRNTE